MTVDEQGDFQGKSSGGSSNRILPEFIARTRVPGPVRRAIRWSRREVLLAFFAAFIAGLGAGAAEALISWALS